MPWRFSHDIEHCIFGTNYAVSLVATTGIYANHKLLIVWFYCVGKLDVEDP